MYIDELQKILIQSKPHLHNRLQLIPNNLWRPGQIQADHRQHVCLRNNRVHLHFCLCLSFSSFLSVQRLVPNFFFFPCLFLSFVVALMYLEFLCVCFLYTCTCTNETTWELRLFIFRYIVCVSLYVRTPPRRWRKRQLTCARDGLWTVCVVDHVCLFSSVQSIVSTISINLFHRSPFRKCSSSWNTHVHTHTMDFFLSTLYSHVFCFPFYFIVVILMLIVVIVFIWFVFLLDVCSLCYTYTYISTWSYSLSLSSSFMVHFLFCSEDPTDDDVRNRRKQFFLLWSSWHVHSLKTHDRLPRRKIDVSETSWNVSSRR